MVKESVWQRASEDIVNRMMNRGERRREDWQQVIRAESTPVIPIDRTLLRTINDAVWDYLFTEKNQEGVTVQLVLHDDGRREIYMRDYDQPACCILNTINHTEFLHWFRELMLGRRWNYLSHEMTSTLRSVTLEHKAPIPIAPTEEDVNRGNWRRTASWWQKMSYEYSWEEHHRRIEAAKQNTYAGRQRAIQQNTGDINHAL